MAGGYLCWGLREVVCFVVIAGELTVSVRIFMRSLCRFCGVGCDPVDRAVRFGGRVDPRNLISLVGHSDGDIAHENAPFALIVVRNLGNGNFY